MIKEYIGLNEISGSLVVLDGVKNAGYEEVVEFNVANGERRRGRIIKIDGERVVAQVFEGTKGLSLTNTATVPTGRPMELAGCSTARADPSTASARFTPRRPPTSTARR